MISRVQIFSMSKYRQKPWLFLQGHHPKKRSSSTGTAQFRSLALSLQRINRLPAISPGAPYFSLTVFICALHVSSKFPCKERDPFGFLYPFMSALQLLSHTKKEGMKSWGQNMKTSAVLRTSVWNLLLLLI